MTRARTLSLAVTLLIVGVISTPVAAVAQEITGTWEARPHERDRGERIQLSMRMDSDRDNWQNGFSVAVSDLWFDAGSMGGDAEDVVFRLERDAGTVTFEGDFRNDRGTGFFTFEPDPDYIRTMAGLGYPGLSDKRVYSFALQDVSTEFVQELHRLGYRSDSLDEADLWKFAIHGVRPEYIRAMNDLGYESIEPEDLIKMRIHGVSPDYVGAIRDALR
ncbi:MAG: hypothetical protein GKS06_19605 [Acidobacteria bacterium]|nr:hypothetical protein [Acidobacteriota bacterium]